jgi:hypothetical protein
MPNKFWKFYLLILILDSVYSIPNRRNKAFGRASFVYPSMYSDSNGNTFLASATDGIMTHWEPDWISYWSGFLFATTSPTVGISKLEIVIDPGTIRTILLSSREACT